MIIERRVSIAIESRVSTPLMFTSALDQHGGHVYKSCILSHKRYVPASAISSTIHWQK